ncbi:MAG TPA: DNA polymerase I [Thiotrichaceae bacterium]|nr:DNA polymerase I [Thiotrichaceae bacterium]HIM07602.1 DNA polymerase I [Gammaproteobacteria bacterium]
MTDHTMVLIDGSYYLFRAYHAIRDLSNAKGEPSGAIYGVINMVQKHLTEGGPDYFAIVFDAKGKTFRNDMYKEYKANRPPMPDDLVTQIQPLHDLIRALGIPLIMVEGVEADDVIATLARQAAEKNIKTIVSTGDKDLAQMVNDRIHLINTMSNTYFDRDGVVEKYGVPPERIIDYLTLMGDTADNVPGVPKVGPKTAVKWINEYGSLDEIISRADEIKGKVGENLREFLPKLPLSKELVTLKYDVELDCGPEDLIISKPDNTTLRKIYSYWNFRSWLAQLEEDDDYEDNDEFAKQKEEDEPEEILEEEQQTISDSSSDSTAEYETIFTNEHLELWIAKLETADLISIDTETTSLDYMKAEIVGLSFAVSENSAAYVPLQHDYPDAPEQLSLNETLEKLKPILEDKNKYKIGQNLKYDLEVFANYQINLQGIEHDTMLASYVVNSVANRHNMDALALNYLNIETIHYEDVAGKGAKQIPFSQVSIEDAAPYAAEDVDIVLKLHRVLSSELKKHTTLEQVYRTIEMPLLNVLARIERNGVVIDSDLLMQQSHELKARMQKIEIEAHDLAGETFNIASPKQIQAILYEKMDLPVLAKTPKGQPSTAESVLQELAEEYKLPKLILEHRSVSKLCSTYTDKLPLMINPDTNRVHTSYHQAVAATGRLSSSNPNLQNIPIRTAEGRKIRLAFIAPEGYTMVAADYSQIELRIMAHLSGDKSLLDAFDKGLDIHKTTAAEVFGVAIDNVDNDQRRAAKAINFGLIYGMSAFGLAKQLGIGRSEAKEYIDLYFSRYPSVKTFMDETREKAKEDGFVETVYHRRLYLPEINARNAARRQYAERTAINAPMQGTAADIIKLAMIDIDEWLQESKFDAIMIMQVHDELVFEVATEKLDEFIKEIDARMTKNDHLKVPLVVDIGHGQNWDEAH